MRPKEKAEELIQKFDKTTPDEGWFCPPIGYKTELKYNSYDQAKQCALIAVDEILSANHIWYKGTIPYNYWIEVKQEIEKL